MRFIALILLTLSTRAIAQPTAAFVDVTVIPMDRERVIEHRTVIVRDVSIATIGPASATRAPPGATVIDGKGKFLIPGLGDAHAHLSSGGGGQGLVERALVLNALTGVTMARSMYTEPHHALARDRVERGEILGPRLQLASPPISGQNTPTPDAARAAVSAHRAAGYAVMKVMPGLSRASFDSLAAEARRSGVRLAGHIPVNVGLRAALSAGMASVEHLDGFLEALIPSGSTATPAQGGFFGFGVIDAVDETLIGRLVADVKASAVVVVPTE